MYRPEIVIVVLPKNVSMLHLCIGLIPRGILTLKALSGSATVPSPTFNSHFAKSSACAWSAGSIWLVQAISYALIIGALVHLSKRGRMAMWRQQSVLEGLSGQ